MKAECSVCVGEISSSKMFCCPFCDFVSCKACVSKFILMSNDEPKCMSCKKLFDREILSMISATFVRVHLKKHREDILLEREMSMMPSTQAYVEQELAKRERLQLLKSLMEERQSLLRRLKSIDDMCRDIQRMNSHADSFGIRQDEKRQFIHKCSHNSCEGFLSSSWMCGICKMYTCSQCNAPLQEGRRATHVCNPEDVETMRLLKTECKKCPGCAQFIHKISGCDQMWCTSCHTTFSWKTGLKVNGTIHNPHYYDFQRQNNTRGRNLGDVPCGGMPNLRELMVSLRSNAASQDMIRFYNAVHRMINHLSEVILPMYPYNENAHDTNRDLRVQFMIGDFSKDVLKIKLQQREKRAEKKRDVHFILDMIVTTMTDLLRQSIIHKDFNDKMDLIKSLVSYANDSFSKVSIRFSCVVPAICLNDDFLVVSKKYKP